ncbi:hypothetical protein LSTR_LSTR007392 [Laodelphax striatellus]|uniref:Tr-type G domain-containing protein n=1 Tax=Laodelphax striatellus TaxID=195883 RepID=A0A482XMU6_LAOST|nr:hypothetical protein LSTR_LSTR007392 [Laodelphax striatellus]
MMLLRKKESLKRVLERMCRRYFCSSTHRGAKKSDVNDLSCVRNIGILAHIDAGKTTTTERMLYYSGKIRVMGEVHEGNTVTDYMEQERDRGITITSAAVTFQWMKHKFNLIDTPGHIDFTMEVEQALHVMDGAVVVLDASAGVEAQTLTVWRQADNYELPRIVYANKMDRTDASLELCKSTLSSKLGVRTLPLQIPFKSGGKLKGIVDVVEKQKCVWGGESGELCNRVPLTETDGEIWELTMKTREELAGDLADMDDKLGDIVLGLDSVEHLSQQDIYDAVRRVTVSQKGVPLLCGSSYKNVGVQLLMDSIVHYLPSPLENSRQQFLTECFKDNLSAKAFKIVHDKQRGGAISFLRLYRRKITKGQSIHNLKQPGSEQIGKLMVALADDYEEVPEVLSGNVAAVTGLKNVNTGDLITTSTAAANSARKYLMNKKKFTSEQIDEVFGVGVQVPDPVFFCSVEPASLKFQAPMEAALKELQRENPSLQVSFNSETGQTVLGGMGELHLEVIKQRLTSEYKVEVDLGPLQIAYKEYLLNPAQHTLEVKHRIGGVLHAMTLMMSVKPVGEDEKFELLTMDKHPEYAPNLNTVTPRQIMLLKQGINSGLQHGPLLGSPVVGASFKLHRLELKRGTSESIFISGAAQCTQKLLQESGTAILEPVMSLEIVSDDNTISPILSDLSNRRAVIKNIGVRGNCKTISALAPLSELLGYSKYLRILSSGLASFTIEFHDYERVSTDQQAKVIQEVGGLM